HPAQPHLYPPSLHDALPIYRPREARPPTAREHQPVAGMLGGFDRPVVALGAVQLAEEEVELFRPLGKPAEEVLRRIEPVVYEHLDRKSTRLNSSHEWISYAV